MGEVAKKKTSLAKAVFSGSLGNMLEWFDYGLYGYFAVIISAEFFAAEDPIVGLLLSFMTFAVGFLVRPLGGILIGAYADKHGRIKALTLTILGMGICTMLMGCLPTYQQIGIAAPILLTVLRLVQGLCTGGEFGSSLTFISEYGTPNNRAFLVSWQPFSVGVGLIIGSTSGLIITSILPTEALYAWGWRIPFICGILIAIYGVYMRRNVPDSPEFQKRKAEQEAAGVETKVKIPFKDLFVGHFASIMAVILLLAGASTSYYLLITYMPTYISQFAGKIVDKIGRRRGLIIGSIGFLIFTYPVFSILVQHTNPAIMIALLGILVACQTLIAVGNAVVSTEIFPTELRSSGVGFAYNLSAAVFGGLAPLVATALIAATGNQISIVWLIMGAILITLITSVFLLKRFYGKDGKVK